MGQHRTPEQLLQEAMDKVNNLKLKVAQSQIASDPRMKALVDAEKEIKKDLSKALKWLDPEKGLNSRIAKLELQIKEAKANLENAEEIQSELQESLASNHAAQAELSKDLDISKLLSEIEG
jgi:DNA-binding transcriptional regulator GbsR (MarR family)